MQHAAVIVVAHRDETGIEAARRIADWRRGAGAKEPPTVRIAMPNGPGADIFYQRIANNLAAIGVRSL